MFSPVIRIDLSHMTSKNFKFCCFEVDPSIDIKLADIGNDGNNSSFVDTLNETGLNVICSFLDDDDNIHVINLQKYISQHEESNPMEGNRGAHLRKFGKPSAMPFRRVHISSNGIFPDENDLMSKYQQKTTEA